MKPLLLTLLPSILCIVMAVVTYGAIFADRDGSLFAHRNAPVNHARAFVWAIFPPMWIVAPIITNGYERGIYFRHKCLRKCAEGEFAECEK